MKKRVDLERLLADQIMACGEAGPGLEQKVSLAQQSRRNREASVELDRLLIAQLESQAEAVEAVRANHHQLRAQIRSLLGPPWFPALLVRHETIAGQPHALVVLSGAMRLVRISDEIDPASLSPGDEVWLGHEQNAVVGRSEAGPRRAGETARFDRATPDGRLVLVSRDEETVVDAIGSLSPGGLQAGDLVRWDRSTFMAFEKVERSRGEHLFLEETPRDSWEDIGGLDGEIARIQRNIRLHLFHGEIAARYSLPRLRGLLLVGPPGVGKTKIARAMARWVGELSRSGRSRFIAVKPGGLRSMWYGQTEQNFREVFRVARAAGESDPDTPVVVFFDEIDSVGAARGDTMSRVDDRILPAFMAELDGLEDRGNVLVVAATNRRDILDAALLRPGRLGDLVVEVPRPNAAASRAIFARHLPEGIPYADGMARADVVDAVVAQMFAPNADTELATLIFRDGRRQTVRVADLVSGADIELIARAARERACLRDVDGGGRGLGIDDLLTAASERFAVSTRALTPQSCRHHIAGLPNEDVVAVEAVNRRVRRPQRYLSAA